ncbi:MAG: AsmA family protein, partial [Sphingomonadales bacterium]|nr:AsmA family protein [Sphingomonadales bacterium]
MSKTKLILGTVVVLVVIFAMVIYVKGTDVIMEASKNASQDTVEVSLEIDDWSLNPFTGTVGIEGLAIGQPPGFGDDESFSIDNFYIDLKPLSLFEEQIKIETILIDKPTINLVIIDDESNFGVIQEKLEEEFAKDQDETDIKMSIDDFYINATTLKIRSEQYGNHEVTLADIHLEDIGVDEGGVPPSEVLRLAMDVINP